MGANAQTSVPAFTAGQVLTAQQQTQINTGVPVFATTTTRDAAFGGTGEKTLAQGQLCYLESTNVVQYYNGSSWSTLAPTSSALTLISATTVGSAVSSVAISSAFSSTYDNYLITYTGGVASTSVSVQLQLGSTTTGYYGIISVWTVGGSSGAMSSDSNATRFNFVGAADTNNVNMVANLQSPNLAKNTYITALRVVPNTTSTSAGHYLGYLNDNTQYTAFTVFPSSGTFTGGTIRVYGYANS